MTIATIRVARESDLARLTEIYNYYVIHTPMTFDLGRVCKVYGSLNHKTVAAISHMAL
jgi:L-amino acid N-acyltransferase YncA